MNVIDRYREMYRREAWRRDFERIAGGARTVTQVIGASLVELNKAVVRATAIAQTRANYVLRDDHKGGA